MSIDTILWISLYICGCLVLFDAAFGIHERIAERRRPMLEQRSRVLILKLSEKRIESLRTELYDALRNEDYLLAFLSAAGFLKEMQPGTLEGFVRKNADVFVRLARFYSRRPEEYKALFAHTIAALDIGRFGDKKDVAALIGFLMPMITDKSFYLRNNSFKALVALGDIESIIFALIRMNEDPKYENSKLLSDQLLEFSADPRGLIDDLWLCFPKFKPHLQVMIIDYLRLLPFDVAQDELYGDICRLLDDDETDAEVRLAAIRYFRKRFYAAAAKPLIRNLLNNRDSGFEFAAISALSLQNYPGKETFDALLARISDPNWYIRYNCAESLLSLGADYEHLVEVCSDKYAKDMLSYRVEVRRRRYADRIRNV